MLREIGRIEFVQQTEAAGGESFVLSSHSRELFVSFAFTAVPTPQTIFSLFGNGPILNGMSETYDQSIIDHALRVRQQRDEGFPATTSRDTEL